MISCGSFTTDGSGNATVDLGYEPQWILQKSASGTYGTGNWFIADNMRGMPVGSASNLLRPNLSDAESSGGTTSPTATGFSNSGFQPTTTYIYIAIRRGPMQTPTSGTEVFSPYTYTEIASGSQNVGFAPDMVIQTRLSPTNKLVWDRLRGTEAILATNAATAENGVYSGVTYPFGGFDNTGFTSGFLYNNSSGTQSEAFVFGRAPGFFDVVCYTGTSANRTVTHNLATAPELMLVKQRNDGEVWSVYYGDNTEFLVLNSSQATTDSNIYWNDTSPTSSVFTLGTGNEVNLSGSTYVAYLFATLAGVSKVGSYTGTGADLNVDCGFSAGARFILIKRTDSSGDWYVWDSARGIVAGDDPYLLLNSSAAEVTNTDYIDPLASGFTVTSNASSTVNVDTGTYIFLAIA